VVTQIASATAKNVFTLLLPNVWLTILFDMDGVLQLD
jgi:hypothetical protein